MPQPSACGYPDLNSVGVDPLIPRQAVSGTVTLGTAGQVLQDKTVTGDIVITAPNVTLRNVKLICDNPDYCIRSWVNVDNELFDHLELDLGGYENSSGIAFDHYTLTHSFIHNGSDCAHLGDSVTIEDSLCSLGPDANGDGWPDSASFCGGPSHFDGFQSDGGSNLLIRHNTIRNPCSQTSGILMSTNTAPITGVTISDNLMAGGGYTLYCDAGPVIPGEVVTGNRFARSFFPSGGFYGPTAHCEDAGTYTGNVWDDTNAPL
jgi:hypothetical protein